MAQAFFTLYAQELGASTVAIGLMVTLRSVFPIFIALPVGQWIDSIGTIQMLKYGSVVLVISQFTLYIAGSIWMLSLSQVLIGICIIMMATSLQVLVSEGAKDVRNENIKKFSMWTSAGNMLGPLLGGWMIFLFFNKLDGYKFTFGVACVASIVCLIVLLFVSRGYRVRQESDALDYRKLLDMNEIVKSYGSGVHLLKLRSVQFGLVATFLIMFIQSMFNSFMPIFLNDLGYSIILISVIISLKDMASLLSRVVLGWTLKHFRMEWVLLSAGFLAALCVFMIPIAGLNIISFVILTLCMGGAVGLNMPVSIMIMVNETKESDRGKLMGLRLIINRLSQIVSPAIFGVVGHWVGLSIAFLSGGVFLLVIMLGFSLFASKNMKGE